MATFSISPEHHTDVGARSTTESSKRQRLTHFMKGRLLRLVSGGDTLAPVVPQEAISATDLRVPTKTVGVETPTSVRMPTVAEHLTQNPKLPGETRTDYVNRMTAPKPANALEDPIQVSIHEPTPEGNAAEVATYTPKHRAEVPPDAVMSQVPVDSHIYNELQAQSRPPLHIVK